jgi:hypothetical protein
MRPSRHHAGAQAAHQTFVFRRIFENLFFHDRHADSSLRFEVVNKAGRSGNFAATVVVIGEQSSTRSKA